ncbi:hypothetical protein ABZS95_36840 [Streptomyces sp. NPDC005479]|uniref:hypothetical protein n=1 Tax=Streptomyces sp. NPDC005479 TaxID=3154879 RepID=UPI00339ED36D
MFEQYDRENAAADATLDDAAIRKIKTGILLKESLATYRIHRKAKTKDSIAHFTKPHFLIPAADRTCGLRRTRYRGLPKTHVQHVLTGLACNVTRITDWIVDPTRPRRAPSHFHALCTAVA